jgi:transcriptional regulator with XRE-family HTH domain
MVKTLGEELRDARTAKGLSLEAVSGPAKVSTAYLHKLEGGRVRNPSPRILQRLAPVVGVPYPTLMQLAGYLVPEDWDAAPAAPPPPAADGPKATNEEIVRLLHELRAEVVAIKERLPV